MNLKESLRLISLVAFISAHKVNGSLTSQSITCDNEGATLSRPEFERLLGLKLDRNVVYCIKCMCKFGLIECDFKTDACKEKPPTIHNLKVLREASSINQASTRAATSTTMTTTTPAPETTMSAATPLSTTVNTLLAKRRSGYLYTVDPTKTYDSTPAEDFTFKYADEKPDNEVWDSGDAQTTVAPFSTSSPQRISQPNVSWKVSSSKNSFTPFTTPKIPESISGKIQTVTTYKPTKNLATTIRPFTTITTSISFDTNNDAMIRSMRRRPSTRLNWDSSHRKNQLYDIKPIGLLETPQNIPEIADNDLQEDDAIHKEARFEPVISDDHFKKIILDPNALLIFGFLVVALGLTALILGYLAGTISVKHKQPQVPVTKTSLNHPTLRKNYNMDIFPHDI